MRDDTVDPLSNFQEKLNEIGFGRRTSGEFYNQKEGKEQNTGLENFMGKVDIYSIP